MCIYLLCSGRFKLKYIGQKTNKRAYPKLGNKTFKKTLVIFLMVSFFRVQSTLTFKLPSLNSIQHEFIQYYIFNE